MSSPVHPFDQQVGALAETYAATPPDHAWAAIVARLPEESRDRSLVMWWLVGAATVLLSAAAWLSLAESPQPHAKPPTPPQPAVAAVVSQPDPAIDQQHGTALAGFEDATVGTQESSIEPSSVVEARTGNEESFVVDGTLPPSSISEVSAGSEPSSPSLSEHELGTTSLVLQPVAGALAQAPTREPLTARARPTMLMQPTSTLPLQAVALKTSVEAGPGIPCADFGNGGYWTLGLRTFAGAGPSGRTYSADANRHAYSALRDSVETVQLSLHGGLRLEAVNSRGFYGRIGADYHMQRSRLELFGNSEQSFDIQEVRHPVTGQVLRYDTIFSTTQSETIVYNRHQTISVTGGLGFRKTFGSVSPYVLAEAGYEFLIASRGGLIGTSDEIVDLSETQQDWIVERQGLHYGGVIGVDVAVTDQLEVGLSGHYNRRGGLSGLTDPLTDERTALYGALNLRLRFE